MWWRRCSNVEQFKWVEDKEANRDNRKKNEANAAHNPANAQLNADNAQKNLNAEEHNARVQDNNQRVTEHNTTTFNTNSDNAALNQYNRNLNNEARKINEQNAQLNQENTYANNAGTQANNTYNRTLQIASNTQGGDYVNQRDQLRVEDLVNAGVSYEYAQQIIDNVKSQFKDFYRTEKLHLWDSSLGAQPPYGIFDPKYYKEQNPIIANSYAEAVAKDDIDITERYG